MIMCNYCSNMKSGFTRTFNWNKYQSKGTIQVPNPYLHYLYLIDPGFQGENRVLVLSFENDTDRTIHTKYYFSTIEIKDYNAMIDGQNVFGQRVKNSLTFSHPLDIRLDLKRFS